MASRFCIEKLMTRETRSVIEKKKKKHLFIHVHYYFKPTFFYFIIFHLVDLFVLNIL
jgi:hypothetical protein